MARYERPKHPVENVGAARSKAAQRQVLAGYVALASAHDRAG